MRNADVVSFHVYGSIIHVGVKPSTEARHMLFRMFVRSFFFVKKERSFINNRIKTWNAIAIFATVNCYADNLFFFCPTLPSLTLIDSIMKLLEKQMVSFKVN